MLVFAVIIAGDGARADIAARADIRIAKITQVVGFGPPAQARLFQLDKIAHMRLGLKHRAGAQPCVGPHKGIVPHMGAFKVRKRAYLRPVADDAVADHAVRGHRSAAQDARMPVNFTRAGKLHAGFHLGQKAHAHAGGRVNDDARCQQITHPALAQGFFHPLQLLGRVHPHEAVITSAAHAENIVFFRHSQADEVGNIVFTALVGLADTGQQAFHRIQRAVVHARVDFIGWRPVERRIVILGFHDGAHIFALPHHAAIRAGVVQFNGGKGQVSAHGFGQKLAHERFREQGRIAVDHQQVGAARRYQRGQSLYKSMPGAELLFLKNKGCVRKGGLHHFGLVAGHNPDVFGKYGAQGRKHTGQHGFAQHGLQNLGLVGMHAGALACRQNEGRVFWHYCLLIST